MEGSLESSELAKTEELTFELSELAKFHKDIAKIYNKAKEVGMKLYVQFTEDAIILQPIPEGNEVKKLLNDENKLRNYVGVIKEIEQNKENIEVALTEVYQRILK